MCLTILNGVFGFSNGKDIMSSSSKMAASQLSAENTVQTDLKSLVESEKPKKKSKKSIKAIKMAKLKLKLKKANKAKALKAL